MFYLVFFILNFIIEIYYYNLLWNRFKTNKNPDENPSLPVDFEILMKKSANKKSRIHLPPFVNDKKKSKVWGKMQGLAIGLKIYG